MIKVRPLPHDLVPGHLGTLSGFNASHCDLTSGPHSLPWPAALCSTMLLPPTCTSIFPGGLRFCPLRMQQQGNLFTRLWQRMSSLSLGRSEGTKGGARCSRLTRPSWAPGSCRPSGTEPQCTTCPWSTRTPRASGATRKGWSSRKGR